MKTNALADEILDYLLTKHSRVYRNKPIQSPTFPYVIFRIESVTDSYPSDEMYLNIDIYEKVDTPSRTIETLADSIDSGLNHLVTTSTDANTQYEREARQYVGAQDLVDVQMINLRYVARVYWKE